MFLISLASQILLLNTNHIVACNSALFSSRLIPKRVGGFLLLLPVSVLGLIFQLAALAGLTAGGIITLLVSISVFSNDGILLDQVMNESRAVRSCLRGIRDGEISSPKYCSGYAQAHLSHFVLHSTPATAACGLSFFLREYHRRNYQIEPFDESRYSRDIREDCSHSDVSENLVKSSLVSDGIYKDSLLEEFEEVKINRQR